MKKWDFKMKGDRKAEVFVYEEIGEFWGLGAKEFAAELKSLGDDVDQIDVRINSMGGSVFEGFTIHSLLKNHKAKVVTKIDGIAASIASVIAMAGDEIEISENGFLMVHEPWTIMIGTAKEFREEAEVLDRLRGQSVKIYATRTGKSEKEVLALIEGKETWLNADEAVEMGFADFKMEPSKAAALTIDRNLYPNAPSQLKHRPVAKQTAEQIDQAEKEREAEAVAVRMRLLDIQEQSA